MAAAAERMKLMRARRHALSLRELRLFVPDPRSHAVRQRISRQVAALDPADERDALDWTEAVSPSDTNRLRARSQVMADKPVTVRRGRVGRVIGRLASEDVARLNAAIAFVMSLAD